MHLKSLQLVGFKSFADKTNVDFLPGVTAIVGPNGCGKSNVSDAIRWVLGEQSAKALRGGEMADVIFSGTDARKAFGMAEVSLTFTDCKDVLKTGQLVGTDVNFEEVTLTRRIFRDGNSEYFINKTPCRLKDVHSVFMDTGIGRSSYSIMEQGKIDKILSSHPEDRRAVFEEAAGITKFKSQKKEALRKLEYTEANLVRLVDIIREVKRQIGSLQRQVGKARRYQALTAEIKHLDTQLGRHEFEKAHADIQSIEKESQELKLRVEDCRLEIEAGEGNITNLREQQTAAEHRRQQILQRQRDIQSEIERHETRIRTNTDRITETETAIQNSDLQASEARVRLIDLQNTLETNRVTLQTAREKLAEQESHLEEAQGVFQRAETAEREHDTVIHGVQTTLLGLEGSLANLRNQVAALEKQRQEFAQRVQRMQAERSVTGEERQKLSQRIESLQTEVHSYKHTFEASRDAVMGGEDSVREAEHQCQVLGASIAEEQRLLSEKTSRRDVLRQLQESYEGYSEGAQALLRQGAESGAVAILGTLANLIEVEPRYSAAIEAGLGLGLQSIVVSEFQTALNLVEQLRSRELGGALFAIREESPEGGSRLGFKREPLNGALAWASDVVRAQPTVAEFVNRLLADMVIVSDLHAAVHLRRQNPGLTLVTMDGDVLDHHGILSAGSPRTSPLRLIGRRNEIAALDQEITHLEARLHDLSARKGEWEGRRALSRQSLGDRQLELRVQETDLTKKDALLGAMQGELRDLDKRFSSAEMEIHELDRLQRENETESVRVRHELAAADAEQVRVHENLAAERRRAEELAAQRHQCSVVVNDLRVAHATTRQQIHGLESQAQPLEGQITESRNFISARETEVSVSRQRVVQWQGESAEAAQQTEVLKNSAAGISGQIAEIEQEKSRLDVEIQSVGESLRALRLRIDEIQKQLTDCEVHLTEKRAVLSHLSERLLRDYAVDLAVVQLLPLQRDADAPESAPIVGDAAASVDEGESVDSTRAPVPIQMTALNFGNWDDVANRVAELRAKIQSMGPVNIEAVQEFEELEQRFNFLTREHDDLVLSKEQLHEILRKINITTKKMFEETFQKIRENFQQIFSELFGGGKADLMLSDENDPLECGIDIVAKPPGKQLQSIMLLSGGERTMTAVALLFAIYMVKPSPFCVLDEMDAPLDESNINRFVKMLERFLAHSQFVIITHNKRTIAMADALYGVTMEERGVSRLVSVKFRKKSETASVRTAERESTEASAPADDSHSRLLVDVPPVEEDVES